MKSIPFNIPSVTGDEKRYLDEVLIRKRFAGDGFFTEQCSAWFHERLNAEKVLLTTSCTHSLEMAAMLIGICPGDEVIMPSFTFVSSANAFALRGAKIKFVDIRPDTMNIDETKIENAITDKTRAILPVHYAGVSCDMDAIMRIADKYDLFVIEDAAQGIMAKHGDKHLGTIGHFGCYSFHETKNIQCGEGGLLIINDKQFAPKAEIIREKGTNKKQFLRGAVDKYTWVDIGSSYLPSELNAAFLFAQLENAEKLTSHRIELWNAYYDNLRQVKEIELPTIPKYATHNAHVFHVKLRNERTRRALMKHLTEHKIQSTFHYIPLHASQPCENRFEFIGEDQHTTKETERLLRLPLFHELSNDDVDRVCDVIHSFFKLNQSGG